MPAWKKQKTGKSLEHQQPPKRGRRPDNVTSSSTSSSSSSSLSAPAPAPAPAVPSSATTTSTPALSTSTPSAAPSSSLAPSASSPSRTGSAVGEGSSLTRVFELREEDLWTPPSSWISWEDHIKMIYGVEQIKKEKEGGMDSQESQLVVHIVWKTGKWSEVPASEAHKKCPQKLLAYYESHIQFQEVEVAH
ncbi:hypothetical protein BCR41DRAFT_350880 [Lobosporangium transversale]|uniref:Chromo shadow domain-containing protein n=1 Tax=Lobosporangium transversale TaxID=64571 RepID=A0A1Y2GTS1_9FUNG|nr:hypothetical protein BCR41DRAFT_350880 [Lobosporangium transversale]ORZ21002.1 hypothetical protein BCR41DRAFT_350880 [Lobosporangium transversale]|eukprot:XP_021882911.1 hypothetical protein BCR41DRAFT_350880 [Lobosporangium transversale]